MFKIVFINDRESSDLVNSIRDRLGIKNLKLERGFVFYDGRQETYSLFVVTDEKIDMKFLQVFILIHPAVLKM